MFDAPVVPQESRSSSTEVGGFPVVPRFADKQTLLPSMQNAHDVSDEKRDPSGKWTADPNKAAEPDDDTAELEQDNADEEAAEAEDDDDGDDIAPPAPKTEFSEADLNKVKEKIGYFKDNGMSKTWSKNTISQYYPDLDSDTLKQWVVDHWDEHGSGTTPDAPVVPDDQSKPYYIKKNDKSAINKDIDDFLANGLTHDEIKEKIKEKWGSGYQDKSLNKAVSDHEAVKAQKAQDAGVADKTSIKASDANDISDYITELTKKHHTDKWLMGKINGQFGHLYPEHLLNKVLQSVQNDEDFDDLIEPDENEDVAEPKTEKVEEPDHAFYDYVKEKTPESVDESIKTEHDPWAPEAVTALAEKTFTENQMINGWSPKEMKGAIETYKNNGDSWSEVMNKLNDNFGMSDDEAADHIHAYKQLYGKTPAAPGSFSPPSDIQSYKDLGLSGHAYGIKDYFNDSKGAVTQDQWQKVVDAAKGEFDESALWSDDGAPKPIEDVLSAIDKKSPAAAPPASKLTPDSWVGPYTVSEGKDILDGAISDDHSLASDTAGLSQYLQAEHAMTPTDADQMVQAYQTLYDQAEPATVVKMPEPAAPEPSPEVKDYTTAGPVKLKKDFTIPTDGSLNKGEAKKKLANLHTIADAFSDGKIDKPELFKALFLPNSSADKEAVLKKVGLGNVDTYLVGAGVKDATTFLQEKGWSKSDVYELIKAGMTTLGKGGEIDKQLKKLAPEMVPPEGYGGTEPEPEPEPEATTNPPIPTGPAFSTQSNDDKWSKVTEWGKDFTDKAGLADALTNAYGTGSTHAKALADHLGTTIDQVTNLTMGSGSTVDLAGHMLDMGCSKAQIKDAFKKNFAMGDGGAGAIVDKAKEQQDSGPDDYSQGDTLTPGQADEKSGYMPAGLDSMMSDISDMDDDGKSYNAKVQSLMSKYDLTEAQAKAHLKYWHANKPKDGGGDAPVIHEMNEVPEGDEKAPKPKAAPFKSEDEWSGETNAFDALQNAIKGGYINQDKLVNAVFSPSSAGGYQTFNDAVEMSDSTLSPEELQDSMNDVPDLGDKLKFLSDMGVPKDKIVTSLYSAHPGIGIDELNSMFKVHELNDDEPAPAAPTGPTVDMTGDYAPDQSFGNKTTDTLFKHFDPENKLTKSQKHDLKQWMIDNHYDSKMGDLKTQFDKLLGPSPSANQTESPAGWNTDFEAPNENLQKFLDYVQEHPETTAKQLTDAIIKSHSLAIPGVSIFSLGNMQQKAKFLNDLGIPKSAIAQVCYENHAGAGHSAVDSAYGIDKLTETPAGSPPKPEGSTVTTGDAPSGYSLTASNPTVTSKAADAVMKAQTSPYDAIEGIFFPTGTGLKNIDKSVQAGGYADKSQLTQELNSMSNDDKITYLLEHGSTLADIKGAMTKLLPMSSHMIFNGQYNADDVEPTSVDDLQEEGMGAGASPSKTPVTPVPTPTVSSGNGGTALPSEKLENINTWAKGAKIGRANLTALMVDPENSSFLGEFASQAGDSAITKESLTAQINAMSDKDKAQWLLQHNVQNDVIYNGFAKLHPKIKPSELAKQLGIQKPSNVNDPIAELSFKGDGKSTKLNHDYDSPGLNAVTDALENGSSYDKADLAQMILMPMPGYGQLNGNINQIGYSDDSLTGTDIAYSLKDTQNKDKAQFLFDHGLSKDEINEAFDAYEMAKPTTQWFNSLAQSKPSKSGIGHEALDQMIKDWSFDPEALVHSVLDHVHEKGHAAIGQAGDTDMAQADMTAMSMNEKVKALLDGGVDPVTVWNAAAEMYPNAPTRALQATLDMQKPEGGVNGFIPKPKEPDPEAPVVPGEEDDGKVHSGVLDQVFDSYKDQGKDKVVKTFVKPFGKNNYDDSGEKSALAQLGGTDLPYDLDQFDQKKKIKYLQEHGYSDEDIWKGLKNSYVKVPNDHLETAFGIKEPESLKEKGDDTNYSSIPALKALQVHQKNSSNALSNDEVADLLLQPFSQDTIPSLKKVAEDGPYSDYVSQLRDHLGDVTHEEQVDFLKSKLGFGDDQVWSAIKKAHPKVSNKTLVKSYGVKAPKGTDMSEPTPTFDTTFKPSEKPKTIEPFGPTSSYTVSDSSDDSKAGRLLRHAAKWLIKKNGGDQYAYDTELSKQFYQAMLAPDSEQAKQFYDKNWDDLKKFSADLDSASGSSDSYYGKPQSYKDLTLDDFKSKLKAFPKESVGIGISQTMYTPVEFKTKALQAVYPGMTESYANKWLGSGGYDYAPYEPEKDADGIPKVMNVWAKHFKENTKPAEQKKFIDYLFSPGSAMSSKEDHPVHQLDLEQVKAGGAPAGQSLSDLMKAAKYLPDEQKAKWAVSKGFDNNAVYMGYHKAHKSVSPAQVENKASVVAPKKHVDNFEPMASYESPLNQYHPQKPSDYSYGSGTNPFGSDEHTAPVIPDYHNIEPVETEEEKKLPHYGEAAFGHFNSHWQKNRLQKPTGAENSAWDDYKGSGAASEINPALRNFYKSGTPIGSNTKKKIKAMNRMFAAYTTPHAFNVVRGSGNNHGAIPDIALDGKTISLAGFTSCSFATGTAQSFAKQGSGKSVLLDIHVPKGMHVIPGVGSESEMILPNMTQFYVQSDKKIKGSNVRCLKLVAIPPKAEDAAKVSTRRIALATLIQTLSTSPTLIPT